MKIKQLISLGIASCLATSLAWGGSTQVHIHKTTSSGQGKAIGTVIFQDTQYGMLIKPHLHNLQPGLHGFHIHQKPHCGDNGKAAGGHFDPKYTQKHLGPYNANGHLGDLPVLYVKQNGRANVPTLAPRLTVNAIEGHSVIIHKHGDNYSDQPKKLGGGGARIACGIISQKS